MKKLLELIKKIDCNWPKKERNNLYPWYVIVWRVCVCLPFVVTGSLVLALGYLLGGELQQAKNVLNNTPFFD